MPGDKAQFEDGNVQYRVYQKANLSELPEEILPASSWNDGYVAFSRGEKRWADIPEEQRTSLWNLKLSKDDAMMPGVEGYVMEINLWRHDGKGIFEEVSIERDDRLIFCQHWKLDTAPDQTLEKRCFFRQAETIAVKPVGKPPIFAEDELRSLECVVPEHRLHFFLTTGKKS